MTPTPQPTPNPLPHYQSILHDLIERAADMARMAHDRARRQHEAATSALPPEQPTPEPDHTIQFDRMARTVRRTVLLAQHLANPAQHAPTPDPLAHRIAARKRILREVQDHIQFDARNDAPRAEALSRELRERLDALDLDDDIDLLPLETVIADIARDLRVASDRAPTFARRTPADAAALDTIAQSTARSAAAPRHRPTPHIRPRAARQGREDLPQSLTEFQTIMARNG